MAFQFDFGMMCFRKKNTEEKKGRENKSRLPK